MSGLDDKANPVDLTVDKPAREFRVEWASGEKSAYGFDYLAALCPCANCKEERKERERNPLTVLSGPGGPAELENVEMVGRYAINFIWRGGCGAGIYSFDYLYDIAPGRAASSEKAEGWTLETRTPKPVDEKHEVQQEQSACPTWVGGLIPVVARVFGWLKRKLLG